MSDTQTPADNTAGSGDRTVLRAAPLGTDAEGDVHELQPQTRTVRVRDGDTGAVEHTEALGSRDVSEWLAYVRAERGAWRDVQYSDESLVETIVAGVEGER